MIKNVFTKVTGTIAQVSKSGNWTFTVAMVTKNDTQNRLKIVKWSLWSLRHLTE